MDMASEIINCLNIIFTAQELQNICIKCWGPIHGTSGNCTNNRVTPQFKEDYIQPTQLIQKFFF
ncbi:18126_t:CDS:1, partial [Rhizophagus irregularis]